MRLQRLEIAEVVEDNDAGRVAVTGQRKVEFEPQKHVCSLLAPAGISQSGDRSPHSGLKKTTGNNSRNSSVDMRIRLKR
ncbi:hypothetical protein JOB18_009085 [Solea senegalensis]|uniref:Uncharacterized protein n=1 Tax=Solea senegalensis TaxID=28829 RepID=A0AAV6RQR5_SOLSE|nr:hypothetical protein JOB18_009085 [Solea senegalensis]